MRRLLPVLPLLAALAGAPARADLKLGYVDLQRALLEVGEGQAAKGRLKAEMDRSKAEIEREQVKLRDDKLVLDKQGAMMSEEVRVQKMTELQNRFVALTQKAEKVQLELAEKERSELKKIFDKMDPLIVAIAQREGLTMMFEKSDSGLVWAPPSMEFTNELVRAYNEKHPLPAKGKAPAAR